MCIQCFEAFLINDFFSSILNFIDCIFFIKILIAFAHILKHASSVVTDKLLKIKIFPLLASTIARRHAYTDDNDDDDDDTEIIKVAMNFINCVCDDNP